MSSRQTAVRVHYHLTEPKHSDLKSTRSLFDQLSAPDMDDHNVHQLWGLSPYINLLELLQLAGTGEQLGGSGSSGRSPIRLLQVSLQSRAGQMCVL